MCSCIHTKKILFVLFYHKENSEKLKRLPIKNSEKDPGQIQVVQ